MNALEFLPFLGHSSIYPPFDDFLTRNGITKRPTLKKNLQKVIFVDEEGLSIAFSFNSSAIEEGFIAKSEGTFIFSRFELMLIPESKKDRGYLGKLPHGLLITDSRELVEQKLGTPKRRNKTSDNYFLDDLVWIVAFEDGKLKFIQFLLPDNDWRESGICP